MTILPDINGIPVSNSFLIVGLTKLTALELFYGFELRDACCLKPRRSATMIKFKELYSNSLYDFSFLKAAYMASLSVKWVHVAKKLETISIMKKSLLRQAFSNDDLFLITM